MNFSLAFDIAKRFRKARKKTKMVSFISAISTFSIALGVAALIIGLSAMNGFDKELHDRVLSVIPHGEVYQSQPMKNWKNLAKTLNDNDHIISVSPYISFTGILEFRDNLQATLIKGIDWQNNMQLAALLPFSLDKTRIKFEENKPQLILGSGLANDLNVKEGEFVTLLIPQIQQQGTQLKSLERTQFEIVKILDLSGELGKKLAMISLENAQKLLKFDNDVSGLLVNVDDIYHANSLIYQAASKLNERVYLKTWESEYGYMYRDIQLIRSVMYLAMIVVIGVACFSIVSSSIIAVKNKSTDIAILRTLGASDPLIYRIFLYYGLISGLIGCFLGILLGIIISVNLSSIMHFFEQIFNHHLLSKEIYFIDFVPSKLKSFDVFIVFLTTLILSLFASLYPAHRACQLDPVKILKG